MQLIDDLERQIDNCERELRQLSADHPHARLLLTVPGIGWALAYTIAAEIGEISRFASPTRPSGYTSLCPRVHQSGDKDWRGPLAKNGPTYLRWALVEAAQNAARTLLYRDRYQSIKHRLSGDLEVACRLTEAIWYMLGAGVPSDLVTLARVR